MRVLQIFRVVYDALLMVDMSSLILRQCLDGDAEWDRGLFSSRKTRVGTCNTDAKSDIRIPEAAHLPRPLSLVDVAP